MQSRVCASVGCVCLSQYWPTQQTQMFQVWCCGLSWQEILIDCCTTHSSAVDKCAWCHVVSTREAECRLLGRLNAFAFMH